MHGPKTIFMKQNYKVFLFLFCIVSISLVFGRNLESLRLPSLQVTGLFSDPELPEISASEAELCGSGTVTLTSTGEEVKWYDAASEQEVHSGEIFKLEIVSTTSYYVKALVDGEPRESEPFTITVNPLPQISFTSSDENPFSGNSVSFTSMVSNAEGPYSYSWDFGDGNTSQAANPTHIFRAYGCESTTFNVTLTVTDANGCQEIHEQLIEVAEQPEVKLLDIDNPFAPEPFNNCGSSSDMDSSYTINVGLGASNDTCVEYILDWGDGSPKETNISFPISHTYSQQGVFEMTITAVGTNKNSTTVVYPVKHISNPAGGLASPGSTKDLCAPTQPQEFKITNWQSNSPGTKYFVDYGDGTEPLVLDHPLNATGEDHSVPHIYKSSNCPETEYVATLTIVNACDETYSTIRPITILQKPVVDFATPDKACVDSSVLFTNTSNPGYNSGCSTTTIYTWDFGDNSPKITKTLDQPENIRHTYSEPGSYSVTLTAESQCGIVEVTKEICVEAAPIPSFTLDTPEVCTGSNIIAVNTSNTTDTCHPNSIEYQWEVSYTPPTCDSSLEGSWNFINGTGENDEHAEFEFHTAGNYEIHLSASNSCGTETTTQSIFVNEPPRVEIEPIDELCAAEEVTINPIVNLINCDQGEVTYLWSFPGGSPSTSDEANPSITYTDSGTYTFSVEVTNECGTTFEEEIFTINPPVIADAGEDVTLCTGGSVQLNGSASGGSETEYSYSWFPEDGLDNPSVANPTASPTATTTYELTVTDKLGCSAVDQVTVFVNTITPAEITGSQILCYGDDPEPFIEITEVESEGDLSYQWQVSIDDTSFINIDGATAPTFDPPSLAETTFYRRITTSVLNGVSCVVESEILTIQVNTVNPGRFNQIHIICSGGDLAEFSIEQPASGTGELSYIWESSTDNENFTEVSRTENFNPPALTETTYYRRTVTSTLHGISCSAVEDLVTVHVVPEMMFTTEPLNTQTLCVGSQATTLEVNLTGGEGEYFYQWYSTNSASTSGGTQISGETSRTYTPQTDNPGTTYYYVVASTEAAGCEVVSEPAEVEVLPTPSITLQPESSELCVGGSPDLLEVDYQHGIGTPQYQWYSRKQGEAGIAIPGATQPTYQPRAERIGNVHYYVEINFASGGCSQITSQEATVSVNPYPTITTPLTAEICSDGTFSVSPENDPENTIPEGTTYTWGMPAGEGFTGGSAATSAQTHISQTLTNTTNEPVIATYTVVPMANGCEGEAFTVTVTVDPKPIIEDTAIELCYSGAFTFEPQNNLPSTIVPDGTTYSWSAPEVTEGLTGGVAEPGADKVSGTLTNSTHLPRTATYTVIPKSGDCEGEAFKVRVIVNPKPSIQFKEQEICSNGTFSISPENGPIDIVPQNTTYTWDAPTIIPAGAIEGGEAVVNGHEVISQTLRNTTNEPATAIYNVVPISGACAGEEFKVSITVLPEPTVLEVTDQVICNGSSIEPIAFSGSVSGTVFHWTNDSPEIGLPASGTGDISAFIARNAGSEPLTATITVSPEAGTCRGVSETFSITVNPSPDVQFSIADQVVCSSGVSEIVDLSSETSDSGISWTATQPEGITGVITSGTNQIPSQALFNHTKKAITVTYTVRAETTSIACPGPEFEYKITVNPVPSVLTDITEEFCSGQPFSITPPEAENNFVPDGTTYTWSAPTGTGFSGGSEETNGQKSLSQTLSNETDVPVTAVYEVTPQIGECKGESFSVIVVINPVAIIEDSVLELCTDGTFTKNPSEDALSLPVGTTYSWDSPVVTGGITGGAAGDNEEVLVGSLSNPTREPQTATYTLTPHSPIGTCIGESFIVEVTVYPELIVTSSVSDYNGFAISSAGGSDGTIDLNPTGGSGNYSFKWEGPNGFSATTEDISNLEAGDYSVTINDEFCAEQVLTFELQEPVPLTIIEVIDSHKDVECYGQATGIIETAVTQVSVSPFTYRLLSEDGTTQATETATYAENHSFNNLRAGIYTIEVIDANGTVKTLTGIEVTQPEGALTISNAVVSDHNGFSISCFGAQNGAIDISISGGTPTYDYLWTGPDGFTATTQDIEGLAPGHYTVEITDASGICVITEDFTITEPDPLDLTARVSDYNGYGISCNAGSDGSISIVPTGGTGDYLFNWSGPNGFTSTEQNLDHLFAGTYTLVLSDTNGCVLETQTFELTEPEPMVISEVHQDVLCYGAATGAIDISVTGGVKDEVAPGVFNYSYLWTGPNGYTSTTGNIEEIPAGDYHLKVTDASGCSAEISVSITEEPEIEITATTTPVSCYRAKDASISLDISGGNGPYVVTWDNLATGTYQDNLGAGDYQVTVTDAYNCEKVIVVTIAEAPIFKIEPVVTQISCYGAGDGSIELNLTGGKEPLSLTWSDGSTAGTTRNNLGPGTYTATINDGTPCSIEETFVIVEPRPLTLGSQVTNATACDNPHSGAIDLMPSGGTPPYTYNWSGGQTSEDLTNITEGNYSVVVTDANGCTQMTDFRVSRQQPLSLEVVPELLVDCQATSVRQINVASASGGVAPYTYTWSSGMISGQNNERMETSQNGTVIVTATDFMGCSTDYVLDVNTQKLGAASFNTDSYSKGTYGMYSIMDPISFTNTSPGDYTAVSWDFGDGSVSNEENPSYTYVNEGTFTITQTVTYPYDCKSSYSFTIEVDKGYKLMVPNAFTPNDDGINDYFKPEHRGLEYVEMYVYDTWGTMLYHEEGAVISGWNGFTKEQLSENGNYYYIINVKTFYGQTRTLEGAFTLIR